jgi:hypothetical protein
VTAENAAKITCGQSVRFQTTTKHLFIAVRGLSTPNIELGVQRRFRKVNAGRRFANSFVQTQGTSCELAKVFVCEQHAIPQ